MQGQVIAVSGGFGVLGRALGTVLLEAGARVALIDRAATPNDLPAEPRLLALGEVALDEAAAAGAAFARIARQWGRLDGLVNIAGGFAWESLETGSVATWDRLYAMNLRSALCASLAALPQLLAGGQASIVNVGALAAERAGSGMGAYAAAKAGVARLTEAAAEEFKDRGLRVNAVLPSLIDTPANRADMPQADATRWVGATALAGVIAFLLSPAAAPINGALIPVRGRL